MFLQPKGRDWGLIVNWDDLGKAYASFIITWSILLVVGTVWLVAHRNHPFIKIRNLPLALTSTAFLHVYLIKICLAYTTNGHFYCSAEYWIMSIYLPFGIALFQANLAQLRGTWEQQQELLSANVQFDPAGIKNQHVSRGVLRKFKNLSTLKKQYVLISIGMLVQIIITAVLYATTPTLQGDWSSFGKVTHARGQALCRKSLPWIPSAFWQMFWTWIYAPYILYQSRHIRDTHMWRTQIIISVISGIPGSPLWLAALYSPKFRPVNRWFVPPMWLAPGIVVMQFVTVFFPMIEGIRSKQQKQETLALLRAWEKHDRDTDSDQSLFTKSTSRSSDEQTLRIPPSPRPDSATRINTMASLHEALATNPGPLLEFAATREFSAENILFLMQVRRWRQAYETLLINDNGRLTKVSSDSMFAQAFQIYETLIDENTADFPINIEYIIKADLDAVFESYTNSILKTVVVAANATDAIKLDEAQFFPSRVQTMTMDTNGSPIWLHEEKKLMTINIEPVLKSDVIEEASERAGFDIHVFDAAEKSIMYLVLTNTWQKFIRNKSTESLAFK